MTVSVILPVYNSEMYLKACLDSLKAQTYTDFEIIAVNDGSTDKSGSILDDYAKHEPRLKVHHFSENSGETKAMQYGIAHANRELHARMDNDDVCALNRLDLQIQCLKNHAKVTVVGSNMRIFGAQTGDTSVPLTDGLIKANFVIARANILNPTSMWRAQWFQEHQVAYGDYKNVSDYGMWVDCMLAGGVFMNLPDKLLDYRMHNKQASSDTKATNEGVQIIMTKLISHWYPQLDEHQAHCLAKICHGAGSISVTSSELNTAFMLITEVLKDTSSRYGEDRAQVNLLILSRVQFWQNIMKQQNPSVAGSAS